MIYFKACPRCRGDMHLIGDHYGNYRQCLQCGHIIDVEAVRFGAKGVREPLEQVDSQAA